MQYLVKGLALATVAFISLLPALLFLAIVTFLVWAIVNLVICIFSLAFVFTVFQAFSTAVVVFLIKVLYNVLVMK